MRISPWADCIVIKKSTTRFIAQSMKKQKSLPPESFSPAYQSIFENTVKFIFLKCFFKY